MTSKLSYNDMLWNTVAEDVLQPAERRAYSSGGTCCPGCPGSALGCPLDVCCAEPGCKEWAHVECLTYTRSALYWQGRKLSYRCTTHGNAVAADNDDQITCQLASALIFLSGLIGPVSSVFDRLSAGCADIELVRGVLGRLDAEEAMAALQSPGLALSETLRLLASWRRRLSRHADEYDDFVCYLDKMRNGTIKFGAVVQETAENPLNLLLGGGLDPQLQSLNHGIMHIEELMPTIAVSANVRSDLSCYRGAVRAVNEIVSWGRGLRPEVAVPSVLGKISQFRAKLHISETDTAGDLVQCIRPVCTAYLNALSVYETALNDSRIFIEAVPTKSLEDLDEMLGRAATTSLPLPDVAQLQQLRSASTILDADCRLLLSSDCDNDTPRRVQDICQRIEVVPVSIQHKKLLTTAKGLVSIVVKLSKLEAEEGDSNLVRQDILQLIEEYTARIHNFSSVEVISGNRLCSTLITRTMFQITNLKRKTSVCGLETTVGNSANALLNLTDIDESDVATAGTMSTVRSLLIELRNVGILKEAQIVFQYLCDISSVIYKCEHFLSDTSWEDPVEVSAANQCTQRLREVLESSDMWCLDYPILKAWKRRADVVLLDAMRVVDDAYCAWTRVQELVKKYEGGICSSDVIEFESLLERARSHRLNCQDIDSRAQQFLLNSMQNNSFAKDFLCSGKLKTTEGIPEKMSSAKMTDILGTSCEAIPGEHYRTLCALFNATVEYRRTVLSVEVVGGIQPVGTESARTIPTNASSEGFDQLVTTVECGLNRVKRVNIYEALSQGGLSSFQNLTQILISMQCEDEDTISQDQAHEVESCALLWRTQLSYNLEGTVSAILDSLRDLLHEVESSIVSRIDIVDYDRSVAEMWVRMSTRASLWMSKKDYIENFIAKVLNFLRSQYVATSWFLDMENLAESIRAANFIVNTVSESCSFFLTMQKHVKAMGHGIPLCRDYCSTDLLKALYPMPLSNSKPLKKNSVVCLDATVDMHSYVIDFDHLKFLSSSLSTLMSMTDVTLISFTLSCNLFLNDLSSVINDILLECSAWNDTVERNFPLGLRRRKLRQSASEMASAKSLEQMVAHPIAAIVSMKGRDELVDVYKEAQGISRRFRALIHMSSREHSEYALLAMPRESNSCSCLDNPDFPFSPVYCPHGMSTYVSALSSLSESLEMFPYIMAEGIVLNWAQRALAWLRDFCDAWFKDDRGNDMLNHDLACKLSDQWSRTIERIVSSEMSLFCDIRVFSGGGEVMETVSPHLRVAVVLSKELAVRATAMKSLTDTARGVLDRSHTEGFSTTVAELSEIRRKMEALSIEPEVALLQEMSKYMTRLSTSNLKLVPFPANESDRENSATLKNKRDISATAPDARKKRKLDSGEILTILEGRKALSISWLHSVSIDKPVKSTVQQHVSLVPLSVNTADFFKPIWNAFGLPLEPTKSTLGDFLGPIPAVISRITEHLCAAPTLRPDRLTCSGQNPASDGVFAPLPPASTSIFRENCDYFAAEDEEKWIQVRGNVRTLMENIFVAAFMKRNPLMSDDESMTWTSAALARGTVLAAEVEEELCSFLCCHRTQSSSLAANRLKYKKHSAQLANNLGHSERLLALLIAGEYSVEKLVRLEASDFMTNNWLPTEVQTKVVSSTSSKLGTGKALVVDTANESLLSSATGRVCEAGARAQPSPTKSRMESTGAENIPIIGSRDCSQQEVSRPGPVAKKTLDLIKTKRTPSLNTREIEAVQDIDKAGTKNNPSSDESDTVLDTVTDAAGSIQLSFEWRRSTILRGFGAAPAGGIGSLKFSPLKPRMEIKGRLWPDVLDRHLADAHDRVMPFIFLLEASLETDYRNFIKYLDGTHVALCEELSGVDKYWVYIVPPEQLSSLQAASLPVCVGLCDDFLSMRGKLSGYESCDWMLCLYVRSSVSPGGIFGAPDVVSSPFPPLELCQLVGDTTAILESQGSQGYAGPTAPPKASGKEVGQEAQQKCLVSDKLTDRRPKNSHSKNNSIGATPDNAFVDSIYSGTAPCVSPEEIR